MKVNLRVSRNVLRNIYYKSVTNIREGAWDPAEATRWRFLFARTLRSSAGENAPKFYKFQGIFYLYCWCGKLKDETRAAATKQSK